MTLSADEIVVDSYLRASGYGTVEAWALDSNYSYDDDHDQWYDDERQPVDVYMMLLAAIGFLS